MASSQTATSCLCTGCHASGRSGASVRRPRREPTLGDADACSNTNARVRGSGTYGVDARMGGTYQMPAAGMIQFTPEALFFRPASRSAS